MVKSYLFIFFSILFVLIFSVLPVKPGSIYAIDIMVLFLLCWCFLNPKSPPRIWMAWCLGLLQDLLLGAMLGEHALALSITMYMILNLIQRMRFFALWQQVLCVGGLTLINQLLIALFEGIYGHLGSIFIVIAPAVMNMVCWLVLGYVIFYYKDHERLV